MDNKIIGSILCGLGIGIAIGAVMQQSRIDALMKINDDLTEAYIRTNIAAALELHKDDWTFTEEEKNIIRSAGFDI